jgi:hypothetical protein
VAAFAANERDRVDVERALQPANGICMPRHGWLAPTFAAACRDASNGLATIGIRATAGGAVGIPRGEPRVAKFSLIVHSIG